MLSVILLAVLAGGAGLLAVSFAEGRISRPRPERDAPSLRTSAPGSTAPEPAAPPPVRDPQPTPSVAPPRQERPRPVAATAATPFAPTGPVRVARPSKVPAAFTAREGTWAELRVPWWRRLLSLALIVVITLVIAVAVASVLGAVAGVATELLNGTIG